MSECNAVGCFKESKMAHGLCYACYERYVYHLKITLKNGSVITYKNKCKYCDVGSRKLGLCNNHYAKFKKYGDPLFVYKPRQYTELDLKKISNGNRRKYKIDNDYKIRITEMLVKRNKSDRQKEIVSEKFRYKWLNDCNFRKKVCTRRGKSRLEKYIETVININNLPFRYVGMGEVLIGGSNPDFISEELKTVIEVFGEYHKIRSYGSIENYIKIKSDVYSKNGYKCVFIPSEDVRAGNTLTLLMEASNGSN